MCGSLIVQRWLRYTIIDTAPEPEPWTINPRPA